MNALALPQSTAFGLAVDTNECVYLSGGVFAVSRRAQFPTGDILSTFSGYDITLLKFVPNAPPIDPTPSIDGFTATPESLLSGDVVTLRVGRVHDPDLRLQSVNS